MPSHCSWKIARPRSHSVIELVAGHRYDEPDRHEALQAHAVEGLEIQGLGGDLGLDAVEALAHVVALALDSTWSCFIVSVSTHVEEVGLDAEPASRSPRAAPEDLPQIAGLRRAAGREELAGLVAHRVGLSPRLAPERGEGARVRCAGMVALGATRDRRELLGR